MNLISCRKCAVVLNRDNLTFADDTYTDRGDIDETVAKYDQETKDFDCFVPCPVCKGDIFKKQKD